MTDYSRRAMLVISAPFPISTEGRRRTTVAANPDGSIVPGSYAPAAFIICGRCCLADVAELAASLRAGTRITIHALDRDGRRDGKWSARVSASGRLEADLPRPARRRRVPT